MKKIMLLVIFTIITLLSTNVFAMSFSQRRDPESIGVSKINLLEKSASYTDISYVDHSTEMCKPQNQGNKGSCVAFAAAYLKSYYESKCYGNPKKTLFSQDFIYNTVHQLSNHEGMTLKEMSSMLKNYGICEYDWMPYDDKSEDYPSKQAFINAEYYKQDGVCANIFNYDDINKCRDFLAKDNVFVALISAYRDIGDLNKNDCIYDGTGEFLGYHGVCVIGYDDNIQAFKVINSWGTNWGDNGYFYIPYKFFIADRSEIYMSVDSSNYVSNNIECYVNKEKIISDVPVTILNSRTYLPLRSIATSLNCDISWNGVSKEICLINGLDKFLFYNKSSYYYYYYNNNYQVDFILSSPVTIINNRTMLPLRDIGDILGKKVTWIKYPKIVDIR